MATESSSPLPGQKGELSIQRDVAEAPCSCGRCATPSGLCCVRFERWKECAKVDTIMKPGRYAQYLGQARRGSPHFPADKERELQIDVERTCPTLGFFQDSVGGRLKLTNILMAWVIHDALEMENASASEGTSPVGYVQGMNFIATVLIWHSGDDELAFWVFVAMMNQYGLRCMFEPQMRGLTMRGFTVAQLLRQAMPELSDHLAEYLRNNLGLLLTEWLLTLFASSVPLGPLGVLWDRFFEEGYAVVYRLILARLRCLRPWLLKETDFAGLVRLVKFVHIDFDCSSGELRPSINCKHLIAGNVGTDSGRSDSFNSQKSGKDKKPSLLKRLVFGKHAKYRAESAVNGADGACDDPLLGGSTGSWNCSECNAADMSCSSWEIQVTVLVGAEAVSPETITQLEQMFDGSSSPKDCRAQATSPTSLCAEPVEDGDHFCTPRDRAQSASSGPNKTCEEQNFEPQEESIVKSDSPPESIFQSLVERHFECDAKSRGSQPIAWQIEPSQPIRSATDAGEHETNSRGPYYKRSSMAQLRMENEMLRRELEDTRQELAHSKKEIAALRQQLSSKGRNYIS